MTRPTYYVLALQTLATLVACESKYLKPLPSGFKPVNSSWAWLTYETPDFRVLPWHFNRTIFQPPWAAQSADQGLNELNAQLNETDFVAYDESFFRFLGPDAKIEQVGTLSLQNHEGVCLTPAGELFFAEWGPPGGDNGLHTSQLLFDTKTNTLRNITTDPPHVNHHGCQSRDGKLYVVNDGGPDAPGELAVIDPQTWKKTSLVNHYYEQPFGGINDIAIDPEGNFYFTADASGYRRGVTPYAPPTVPSTYFINGSTFLPKVLQTKQANNNGITLSPSGTTLYLSDSGVSRLGPANLDPYGKRGITAYDFARASAENDKIPLLVNERLLIAPIARYYDGLHASAEGYLFGAARDTIDVVDPETGLTLGAIRVGSAAAVNFVLEPHGLWIVGYGGVWHVSGVAARLV